LATGGALILGAGGGGGGLIGSRVTARTNPILTKTINTRVFAALFIFFLLPKKIEVLSTAHSYINIQIIFLSSCAHFRQL
jgi:hypothetical protein